MATVTEMLMRAREELAAAEGERQLVLDDVEQMRTHAQRERRSLTGDAAYLHLRRQLAQHEQRVRASSDRIAELEAEVITDEAADRLTRTYMPRGTTSMDIIPNMTRLIAEIEETKRSLERSLTDLDDGTASRAEVEREMRIADAQIRQLRERLTQLQDEAARYNASNAGAERWPSSEYRMDGSGRITVTERQRGTSEQWVRTHDRRPAVVERNQRFSDHEIVREHAERNAGMESAVIGQHGSFGNLVRSMSTSSGSALVPTVWASDIIDRARNYAAVLQAGAQIVPMDAKVVQIGRLTADPTASFRTEGSTITASDPVFDNVTLTATTQSALVVGSLEWFQDAENVDEIVSNAIAKAIGLNLDLVALYGSITSGAGTINLPTPPNPRGILGALNASAATSVLGAAANGTAQTAGTFWNEVLDTIYTPQDYNEHPNAMIWNSKVARKYAKTYDTQGNPLRVPDAVQQLQKFVSNQIPSYTQGTMTNVASDIFVGDFNQCLIGQRLDLTIQTLTERYAELGQVGIVANWRGDVGIARPRAFSVYKAIQGS